MATQSRAIGIIKKVFRWLDEKPFVGLPLFALLTVLIVEGLSRRTVFGGFEFALAEPLMFLFNWLIVLLTLSPCQLAKRKNFFVGLVCTVWLVLGVVNYILLSYRTTPLGMIDLFLAGSAIKILDVYMTPAQIALACVGLLALIAAAVFAFRHCRRERVHLLRALSTVCGLGAVVALFSVLVTPASAISESFGNLASAYDDLGFAYCFSTSVIDRGVSEPDDYSEQSVAKAAGSLSQDTVGTGEPDVIFLQLESFFDLTQYSGADVGYDPTPVFNSLKETCSTGYLTMPSIGAGTANSEFEVLTGMNMDHFGAGEYPYKTVLSNTPAESLAREFSSLGYSTAAVHNHIRSFYGRDNVFAQLGFDRYIALEDMENVSYTPTGWANDDVLTGEIISALDESDGSDFIYAITVQGHGKYTDVDTGETEEDDSELTAEEAEAARMQQAWEYYASQISGTDAFIGELLSALTERDEPVVVVMYGDHLPSLEIDETLLESGDQFCTEYIIWSNIGLEKQELNLNAYQLGAYVQQRLGLCVGTLTALHQEYAWDTENESYQHDLQTLEYDMLYGEHYLYGGELPFEATELKH